jgi:hypothetical protein
MSGENDVSESKEARATENRLTFEQEILRAARHSIVKMFNEGSFVMPDYANRMKVPTDLVTRVYGLIDYDTVIQILRPKINEMIADRIAAAMSQELTGDVKKVLSHEPTRLRLRLAVMNELEKAPK